MFLSFFSIYDLIKFIFFSFLFLCLTIDTKQNIKEETLTTTRFPCNVCNKSYLRKRHLQRHMRDECIGIPPRFHCEYCPSKFRRKYHLVRHLSSKHGIPKMFNTSNSVTLTQLSHHQVPTTMPTSLITNAPQPHTPGLIKTEDTANNEIPNNILPMPPPLAPSSTHIQNINRFSVDALMMKQEVVPEAAAATNVPLDFSNAHPEEAGEEEYDEYKIQPDISLQRTFQNLKYLFANYAINNVPNFST